MLQTKELPGDTGQEIIGIRSGEKLHEILSKHDEIRNTGSTTTCARQENQLTKKNNQGLEKFNI